MERSRRKGRGPSKDVSRRKDRLIQTRVPRGLERALKREAEKRRLSVSHLIRNVLEDTFDLVDHVVTEVDAIVSDSVGLAKQVQRDARRIAESARGHGRPRGARGVRVAEPGDDALAHIYAWNKVVLNRPARCARCGAPLERGSEAHLGLTQQPNARPTWLCDECVAR